MKLSKVSNSSTKNQIQRIHNHCSTHSFILECHPDDINSIVPDAFNVTRNP